MPEKSELAEALDHWSTYGGDLRELLEACDRAPVKTRAEATAICRALETLRDDPAHGVRNRVTSPLHALTGFFQNAESKDALEVLQNEGLPLLRLWLKDHLAGDAGDEDDLMFLIKILAMYRQQEDQALIADAVRKPVNPDGYMWSVIFNQFDKDHPHAAALVDALRDPLPKDFLRVAYLDLSNSAAIAGQIKRHPFDTPAGHRHLEAYLLDSQEENFSYANSATTAIPFLAPSVQAGLLKVAAAHPDIAIRMEAAWAQAKTGDSAGLDQLAKLCLDPRFSLTAQHYLDELGKADAIPESALQSEFQAVAEMAAWLAHPMEFGRPPSQIELFDRRELFWPPTNDRRSVALVKYVYAPAEPDDEPDCGIGMVGSVTFALFGEATTDLTPEDVYGLHCAWELEMNEDDRAPKKRTPKAGRKILGKHNKGF